MELPDATFYTRAALMKIGVSDGEIKRALRRGTVVSLGNGAYADALAYSEMTASQRHVMSVRAVSAACGNAVISHQSAAVVHGLEMWNPDLSRVHLSVDTPYGGRTTPKLHVHTNRLTDVTVVEGLTVTGVAATAADLARSWSFEKAVCVADSALATGKIARSDLEKAVDSRAGLAGCGTARRVVQFADGLSETVGESRSRVYVQRYGFPKPELQVNLRNPNTGRVMRPDMLIAGVVLEFDGKLKYTSQEVLFAEKRREDELTSLGWVVVRWTWDDLASDAGAVKLARGLERAAGLPPPSTIRI